MAKAAGKKQPVRTGSSGAREPRGPARPSPLHETDAAPARRESEPLRPRSQGQLPLERLPDVAAAVLFPFPPPGPLPPGPPVPIPPGPFPGPGPVPIPPWPIPGPGTLPPATPLPLLRLRLQFIATTNTITFNPQLLVPVVNAMNVFFAPGKIEFQYDPALDFAVHDDKLLDQDWELVDVASLANPKSVPPTVDVTRFHGARQDMAARYLGKLVVFIGLGSNLEWQDGAGWTVGERGYHYSSTSAEYVATAAVYWRAPGGSIDANTLGHEIGHYLHQVHTMGYTPDSLAAAAQAIRGAVDGGWSRADVLRIFDGDHPWITDTPPDPGPDLFGAANGAPCGGPAFVDVPVTFADGSTQTFRLEPDRTHLMSYFKGCPGAHGFSAQQFFRMRVALEHGNRNALLTGRGSYVAPPPALVPLGGVAGVVVLDVTSSPWFGTWAGEDATLRPAWTWLGGFGKAVSCASDAPGNVDIVLHGTDGFLYHKSLRGGTWSPQYAWSRVGSIRFAGSPVLVSWGAGRLDLFAVAEDGTLDWSTNRGTGWSGWQSIGVGVMGTPAVVCSQPNRIDVVAWRTDRGVMHSAYDGTRWSPWQSLNGMIDAPPSVCSWGPGRLDLVVRGTDHAIYHKWLTATGWNQNWESMGGNFVGTPVIAASPGTRLDIVTRDADNALWHKAWDGGSWAPSVTQWRPLGGAIVDSPRLLTSPAGNGRRLDVFARARDGSLLHCALDAAGQQSPGAGRLTRDPFPTTW